MFAYYNYFSMVFYLICPFSPQHWFLDGEVICFGDAGHIFLGLIAAFVVAPLSFALPALFLLTCVGHSNVVQVKYLLQQIYIIVEMAYSISSFTLHPTF